MGKTWLKSGKHLHIAAFKYDAASPGPIGLKAFNSSVLSPAVFREMLRRSFDIQVRFDYSTGIEFNNYRQGYKNLITPVYIVIIHYPCLLIFIQLTDEQLAALLDHFESPIHSKMIDCTEFVNG
jgi:hypothetical protein